MAIDRLRERLRAGYIVLLDGGVDSEVVNRGEHGAALSDTLLRNPRLVEQIHEDYILSGAEVIRTNTADSTQRALDKHVTSRDARGVTILACEIAQQARRKARASHDVYIAGSVGTLEDSNAPELTPSDSDLASEHHEIARNLRDGGVDFTLIETMNTLRETLAALNASEAYQLPSAVTFSCNDKFELLSGEPLSDVIAKISPFEPLFIGVSCASPQVAGETAKYLRSLTHLPLSVHAQIDHIDLKPAEQWLNDGVQVVGGHDDLEPRTIRHLRGLVASRGAGYAA